MKKLLGFSMCSLLMAACGCSGGNSYKVVIPTEDDVAGSMAYLVNFDNGQYVDSAKVGANSVVFEGTVDTAMFVRVEVNGDRAGMLILEPGTITVDSVGTVSGTALNKAYGDFIDQYRNLALKIQELPDSATAEREAVYADFQALQDRVIAENSDNPVGYYLFLQKCYELSPVELDSLLNDNPGMRAYTRIQKLEEAGRRQLATSPGCMFTDFEVEYNGEVKRLSDYVGKGKYTLVDFWASWCGPCIRQTRVIKELYEKYAGKLDVVGVAVWDAPADTEAAVENHQLPWPEIINAQTIPTDLYGISGIPCIILFDPEGRIVSRGLQDDALRNSVAGALAE